MARSLPGFALLMAALALNLPARGADDPLPAGAAARLGSVRFRTGGEVKATAFAPDGRTIAAASDDGAIYLYDAATGTELRRLRGHEQGVRSVAFSPDGKLLASACYDQTVRIWDPATGKELHDRRIPRGVALALAFAPDGKVLASAHRNRAIVLTDPATGQEIRSWANHGNWVTSVAFAPDGQTLVSASRDRSLRLWKLTGEEIRRIDLPQTAHAALFNGGGSAILASSSDGAIREYETATGKELRTFAGHHGNVYGLVRSQGVLASCGSDGTLRLWDLAAGKERRKIAVGGEALVPLALTADGARVATALAGRHGVRLFDTANGAEVVPAGPGHEAGISALSFSPDGKTLASAGADRNLFLWDPATGKLRRRLEGHQQIVRQLAWSESARLASTGDDRTVRIWDVAMGKEEQRHTPDEKWGLVSLAFTADGKPQAWMSAATDPQKNRFVMFGGRPAYSLHLTDLADNRIARSFELNLPGMPPNINQLPPTGWPAHGGPITAVGVAGNRALLATGSGDSSVAVWRMTTGKFLGKMAGHSGRVTFVGFTADDRTIISAGDDGVVRLWETATRTETLQVPAAGGNAFVVALTPDGRTLAWASPTEQGIHLWDITTGKDVALLPSPAPAVLAFAPDGKRLASGSTDTTVLLWNVPHRDLGNNDLPAGMLDGLWTALADDKAAAAYPAMWQLRAAPTAAVAFFKDRLKPTPANALKPVARLIKELDDTEFEVRSAAQKGLESYGELAETELTQALERRPPLEVVRRIEELLFTLEQKRSTGLAPPEDRRIIRSVQTLEWIATPDARALLQSLATGSPLLRQTQEARAALARLNGSR